MATNSSINSSNPIQASIGGTGLSSATSDGILYGNGTSAFGVTAAGTAGQVLAATSGAPAWSNAGSMVLIQSQVVSSSTASVTFSTGITTTYNTYLLVYSNVVPVTSTAVLYLTFGNSGGTISTGYTSGINTYPYNSSTGTNANTTSQVLLSGPLATTSGLGVSGTLWCYDVTNGSQPCFNGQAVFDGSTAGNGTLALMMATVTGTTLTSFILAMSSGNISTATFSLFGVLE